MLKQHAKDLDTHTQRPGSTAKILRFQFVCAGLMMLKTEVDVRIRKTLQGELVPGHSLHALISHGQTRACGTRGWGS